MNTVYIDVIRAAIRNARSIAFHHDGHFRVVCPHALGTKRGEWHLFGLQIDGGSNHGLKRDGSDWRCFILDDISGLVEREGDEWQRGWTKGLRASSCIDAIDTVVDAAHAAQDRYTSTGRIR